MELLFESRLEILDTEGKMYFVQADPEIEPEPVLRPDPDRATDALGAYVYGTVLHDGGRFRLWYQAVPKDWSGADVSLVGYAESDDGISWRKPNLRIVEYGGSTANNLCNLNFHCPAVFIDPTAPPDHRYRATGYASSGLTGVRKVARGGYYTAHSADGLRWELDTSEPQWEGGDVITSIYHPQQQRAIVALKHSPRYLHIRRRSIWNTELRDGAWSKAEQAALIPDEYDDIAATGRGFASGDYYGMGMMPSGRGTVGFVWQFRHTLPRTRGNGAGVFGAMDVSLAYQAGPGDRWLHLPGRKDFLRHGTHPWNRDGIYTSSAPVTVGDEQRLYISGSAYSHGWEIDDQWRSQEKWLHEMIANGLGMCIGYARWPKHRLFGFRADPEGILTLDLGTLRQPSELYLNCQSDSGGSVRVELPDRAGHALADAVPLALDHLESAVRWHGGTVIQPPADGKRLTARLHLEKASVYAYAVRPAR